MGTDLYYTIPEFFEKRMHNHDCVQDFWRSDEKDEFIYCVRRHNFQDTVRVWLSDAYLFTEMDYHNRPPILKSGDFIVVAKPEGGHQVPIELIKATKIGVENIGVFMGALNRAKMWTYVPNDRK